MLTFNKKNWLRGKKLLLQLKVQNRNKTLGLQNIRNPVSGANSGQYVILVETECFPNVLL